MVPMIAKAKRRRANVLSIVAPAHAATRISIPTRHPAASRSLKGLAKRQIFIFN
jgi:hypothetical protein